MDSISEEYGVDQVAAVPARSDPVVSVRGLVKRYGSHEAVAGIDLDVRPGEIFAFLGPNGAGKTTTVEILEGFRQRTEGQVSVLGHDPATAGGAWRDRVGVVLQVNASPACPSGSAWPCTPGSTAHRETSTRPSPWSVSPAGGRARHQAVGRPAAPARLRARPHRRPRARLPGRADHRFRPVRPPRRLEASPGSGTRQDRLPHHPLHGRGGIPGRPDHGALRGAHHGRGHAADTGRTRPHDYRHQLHASRSRAYA